jgi:hypothetical protein
MPRFYYTVPSMKPRMIHIDSYGHDDIHDMRNDKSNDQYHSLETESIHDRRMAALDWLTREYVSEWLMQVGMDEAAHRLSNWMKISKSQEFPIKLMAKTYLDANQTMNILNMSGVYDESTYECDIFYYDDVLEPLLSISKADTVISNMIRNTVHKVVCIAYINGVDVQTVKQKLIVRLLHEAYHSIVPVGSTEDVNIMR